MKQQTVLITGTSSGFGLLAAVALAKQGHYVVATMRDVSRAETLRQAMQRAGVTERQYEVVQLDVTDHAEVQSRVDEVLVRTGHIDVLINNAGYAQGGLAEELPLEKLRAQFETNFFGAVAVTQAVLPAMRERRSGKIINISSVSGRIGFPALSAYVASKHALEGFSESLRLELLPFGVHVVLVEPASFKTDIWGKGAVDVQMDTTSPYYDYMSKIRAEIQSSGESAADPSPVIDLLVRLVHTEHPRLRYLVGRGTTAIMVLKAVLPSKWLDWFVLRKFGS